MNRVEPRPSPELRCAFCHGSAVGAEACPSCGTLTHPGCRLDAGGCVTIGCVVRTPVRVEFAAQPKSQSRALLVVLLLIASCLVWAAVTPFYPNHLPYSESDGAETIMDKINGPIR